MQDDYRDSPEIQQITDDELDIEHLPDLLEGIKKYGVILPSKDIQFPIIKHYLCCPSHKCSVLGVLFSYGSSGSGKSDITKIASAIHGLANHDAIVMAESSPASIRNKINLLKYGEDWREFKEQGISLDEMEGNCILLWDDIKPHHLKKDIMLSLLKSSYNRKSAIVEIADPGTGKNIAFNVFSKKVTSSIHPIWQDPNLIELKRRFLPIKHIPYSAMSEEDKASNLDPSSEDLILWEYVDFSEYRGFENYWDSDRLEAFSNLLKDRKIRNVIRKANIDSKYIQLSSDIMVTGMIIDDCSISEIADIYEVYWDFVERDLFSKKSTLETFLISLIDGSFNRWNEMGLSRFSHEIQCDELQRTLTQAVKNGQILDTRWRYQVKDVMAGLGYEQGKSDISPSVVWKRNH